MQIFNRSLVEGHDIGAHTREWLVSHAACPALKDAGITLCGVSEARPGFHFVRNNWGSGQILITISGRGRVFVDREWPFLEAGQVHVQPPHALHAYQAVEDTPWVVAWAMWSDASVTPKSAPWNTTTEDAAAIHAAIMGLHAEIHGAAQTDIAAAYVTIISQLFRRPTLTDEDGPSLRSIWEMVSADPGHAWSLAQLAEAAGMHEEQLRRRCVREVGQSPIRRVTELRMRHAAALLTTTALPISAIAERVGYQDPFAFSTAFRRIMGSAPSTLRK